MQHGRARRIFQYSAVKKSLKCLRTIVYLYEIHCCSSAFDNRLSVTILRLPDGLDYSKITEEDEAGFLSSADLTLTHPSSTNELTSNRMMHADSNFNIAQLGVMENVVSSSLNIISTYLKTHARERKRNFLDFRCRNANEKWISKVLEE